MKRIITLVGLGMIAGSVSAALMSGGYTAGSGLLSPGSETLFIDTAAGGGTDITETDGNAPYFSVLIPGSGLWNIGDTVEITGVALQIQGSGTDNGTLTFDILKGAGGSGASGAGGLASLGSATALYQNSGTNDTMYVNFDTAVSFVVDANSTSIGINVANETGKSLRLKAQDGFPVTRYNASNGNISATEMKFSVAGNVIPEPATIGLVGLFGGAVLFIRRRFML